MAASNGNGIVHRGGFGLSPKPEKARSHLIRFLVPGSKSPKFSIFPKAEKPEGWPEKPEKFKIGKILWS